MKLALIGYGKMGREIESMAHKRGIDVSMILDENNIDSVSPEEMSRAADVAIEFSTPGSVVNNIYKCFEARVPVVVGTTGWYDHLPEVMEQQKRHNSGLFYATNFSIGVNVFFEMNKFLARMMNKYPDYDVSMEEQHHVHKKDSPSGTGITIAEGIIEHFSGKKKYSIKKTGSTEEIHIEVVRDGEIPGTHIVKYHSEIDDIVIKHIAHNRKGFALGAVLAAEYMNGKHGVYGMKDLMGF